MLAIVALSLAILFFVLLRSGILDQLPERLGRGVSRRPAKGANKRAEEQRRLEVFKDFIEGDPDLEK